MSEFLYDSVFAGSTVLCLGAGLGQYEQHWSQLKKEGRAGGPASWRSFDGAENIDEVTAGRVEWADLTEPLPSDVGTSDWVLSLEVAEHISAEHEPVFLENLVAHCRHGIIMSWGIPGQSGHFHINNRDAEYIVRTLEAKGLIYDTALALELRSLSSQTDTPWFKDSIYAFRRS